MATKPSPSTEPRPLDRPSLGDALPTAATATQPTLRCIQRPTGEWFTFAPDNPPGRDTPDAADLLTESEARAGLHERGVAPDAADAALAAARAQAEVSGDIADWNVPPGGGEA
jgi:hypothetical protein